MELVKANAGVVQRLKETATLSKRDLMNTINNVLDELEQFGSVQALTEMTYNIGGTGAKQTFKTNMSKSDLYYNLKQKGFRPGTQGDTRKSVGSSIVSVNGTNVGRMPGMYCEFTVTVTTGIGEMSAAAPSKAELMKALTDAVKELEKEASLVADSKPGYDHYGNAEQHFTCKMPTASLKGPMKKFGYKSYGKDNYAKVVGEIAIGVRAYAEAGGCDVTITASQKE